MNEPNLFNLLQAAMEAHGEGRFPDAYKLYNEILETDPSNIEALKRLSVLMMQTGQNQIAYETIKRGQRLKPKSRSVMEIFGAAAMANEDYAMAVRVFEALAKNKPVNPLYFSELSQAEYGLKNYKRAIARFQEFLKHTPNPKPRDYFVLGRLYFLDRQPWQATQWLDKALEGGFENSEILAIRANCYIHDGDQATAIKFFERALELDPDNVEAHYQHRNLIKTEAGDPIFARLEGLKGSPKIIGTPEINLYFLLGRLYQRVGEDDQAFENYLIANQKTEIYNLAQGAAYDAKATAAEFALLKKAFSRTALKEVSFKGSDSEVPVFIVGLPRSGTTLLEQIISAHPKAEGRGELEEMHFIHLELEKGLKGKKSLQRLLDENAADWQTRYLKALDPKEGVQRITDKLPANCRDLGLISLLFPKARVIHIHRNPMDVGFSIFSNPLATGHPYSTSLKNIGDYIWRTLDLMAYWKKELPIQILDLAYEDLVANQKKVSKEVIGFLGLEWDPVCLEFHTQDRAAMTLSSIQVRKPMTAKSVARWKRFEKHLAPLKAGLGPALAKGPGERS